MEKDITLLTLTLQKEIEYEDMDEYLKQRDELMIVLEDLGFSVDIDNEDMSEELYFDSNEDE